MGEANIVALSDLADYLHGLGIFDVKVEGNAENLLVYHYSKEQEIYGFFHTGLAGALDLEVTIPVPGDIIGYDAMDNRLYPIAKADGKVLLHLEPYESRVLLVGNWDEAETIQADSETCAANAADLTALDISKGWKVAKTATIRYPDFPEAEQMERLVPISVSAPEFSGVMRYEKTVSLSDVSACIFKPQYIYETAEVFVNGASAGKKLTPPYIWEIGSLCHEGDNKIVVEVANTPARDARRAFSPFGPEREVMEPSGMFGTIQLLTK